MEHIHELFKSHVKEHRGGCLKESDLPRIFSADVVTGDEAKELGLVDELGNMESVMESDFPDVEIQNFSKTNKFEEFVAMFRTAYFAHMSYGLKSMFLQ